MERDIFCKYAGYIFTALGLATVAGTGISVMAGSGTVFNFSLPALLSAELIFLIFSLLLCVVMAKGLTKAMNRKSIVERLREIG